MKKTDKSTQTNRRPPARTPEGRERQMISLAMDVAEKQLMEGTAKPSVIVHFLKLGSTLAELEKEELRYKTQLAKAKTDSINDARDIRQMYAEAMQAMVEYSPEVKDYEDDD